MSEIYFDNSATTKTCQASAQAALQAMTENYGNPSSLHAKGASAAMLLHNSRNTVLASLFGDHILKKLPTRPSFKSGEEYGKIIFTAGGTESNNIAITSAVKNCKISNPRVITTDSEHPSVLRTLEALKDRCEIVYLSTQNGSIDYSELDRALTQNTVLVSVMHVNNETGAVNDIEKIFATVKDKVPQALCHSDCVQSFQKLELSPIKMKADMISVSGHKIHAPKGVGALWISSELYRKNRISPIFNGGGQEYGLRSGTENIAGIAAMAAAVKDNGGYNAFSNFRDKTLPLRSFIINGLSDELRINQPDSFAPHIISVSLPGQKSHPILNLLSKEGIYLSAGSACSSHKNTVSHVLTAFGLSADQADSTIRISLSASNTEEEAMILCEKLNCAIKKMSKK